MLPSGNTGNTGNNHLPMSILVSIGVLVRSEWMFTMLVLLNGKLGVMHVVTGQ